MIHRADYLRVFVRFLKTHNALEKYKRKLGGTPAHDFEGLMWHHPAEWIIGIFPWGSEGGMWCDLYDKWNLVLCKLR